MILENKPEFKLSHSLIICTYMVLSRELMYELNIKLKLEGFCLAMSLMASVCLIGLWASQTTLSWEHLHLICLQPSTFAPF